MKTMIISNNLEVGQKLIEYFNSIGSKLIFTTKSKRIAEKLKENFKFDFETITIDVASTYNCKKLHKKVQEENIDIIINCICSEKYKNFNDEKIDAQLDLIDSNIKATHTLTKLFLIDFEKKDKGSIFNLCLENKFENEKMNITYNASKSYISMLICAIKEELRRKKSHVNVDFITLDNIDDINEYFNKVIKKS